MPYLSHNYRFQEKSKLKSSVEMILFVGISTIAIFFTLFIMGWITASAAQAAAGINTEINYQGKLNDKTAGTAVANQNWNFRFSIYADATGGTPLWKEVWTSTSTQVSTINGVFSVALGSITAFGTDIDFNSDSLYLQIDMDAENSGVGDGDWEESFSGRKRLASTPYAFNSDTVDGIHATSTAAVANYLLALDAQGNLDLFGQGVSSTYATTTNLYVTGNITGDGFDNAWDTALNSTTTWNGFSSLFDTNFNSTTTWTGFDSLFDDRLNATTTLDLSTLVVGNATTTGTFNVDGYATTTGGLFTQGNLHVGGTSVFDGLLSGLGFDNAWNAALNSTTTLDLSTLVVGSATTTGIFTASQYASTTNLVLSDEGSNISSLNDIYVSGGNLFYDAIQLTGASGFGISNWWATTTDTTGAALFKNSIAPTTTISLYLPEDLVVQGNATTTGTIHIGGNGTSTFSGNVSIAEGGDLQVSNIYAYSPITISADLIIAGNATVENDVSFGYFKTSSDATSGRITRGFEFIRGSNITTNTPDGIASSTGSDGIDTLLVKTSKKPALTLLGTTPGKPNLGLRMIHKDTASYNVLSQVFSVGDGGMGSRVAIGATSNGMFNEVLSIRGSGQVGVGVFFPTYKFTVANQSGSSVQFSVDSSGNATTSGRLVVGTTNPNQAIGAGDLFVGDDAFIFDDLLIGGIASTTGLVLSEGADQSGINDLYVSGGSLYFNTTQLGSPGVNDWEVVWGDDSPTLRPTSTNNITGLFVNASSTIAANFRVDGSATTTGGLSVDGSTFIVQADTNRVGIGTASPDATLAVTGTASTTVAVNTQGTLHVGGAATIDGDLTVTGASTNFQLHRRCTI